MMPTRGRLLRGRSSKSIAYELRLAPSTVSEVASVVGTKVGLRSIAELVALAIIHGPGGRTAGPARTASGCVAAVEMF